MLKTQQATELLFKTELSEEEYGLQMFQQPCFSSHQQTLKLVYCEVKDQEQKLQNEQTYEIQDLMTISKLRSKWYKNNIVFNEELDNPEDRYVLMWGLQFPLYPHYTMLDIKNLLQIQKFDDDVIIRVYYQWDCPYQKDQAAVSFEQFAQKYQVQIQSPFKIVNLQSENNFYFYLKFDFKTLLSALKEKLDQYLLSQLSYDPKNHYKLYFRKNFVLEEEWEKIQLSISKAQKDIKINDKIDFFEYFDTQLKVRQVCPPGYIIQIQLDKPEQAKIKSSEQLKYNPQIQIVSFERKEKKKVNSNILTQQQELNKQNKLLQDNEDMKKNLEQKEEIHLYKKRTIKKYSQIRNIKINTILHQQKVDEPLQTSLFLDKNTPILKPFDNFKSLDKYINENKLNQNFKITLTCVPQNFLYYREMNSLQNSSYKRTMQQLINDLIEKNKKMPQTVREQFKIKRQTKFNDQQIQAEHKNENFLDPIILYTSPYLYSELNVFLRKSSISWFQNEKLLSPQFWQYPFCQKLLKSLLKLQNYNKTNVYRGSLNHLYNYNVGEIIEWNCFNSTSSKKDIALYFITQQTNYSSPFLFQIKTFSGKHIHHFSYYGKQFQVLLLPYTKFKVTKIIKEKEETYKDKTVNLTYVELIQLPIPKKIPGNIIVWIDANISQNSRAFNKIIKIHNLQDFDLVQLESNQHFKMWLNQYKDILSLPEANVHFISNMNRPPIYKQEGIQTLEIIRSFRKNSTVVFYIGNVQNTWSYLREKGHGEDENLQVIRTLKDLEKIFLTKFIKK